VSRVHRYEVQVTWTGNLGEGTASYRAYARDHESRADSRPVLAGSSDPSFRGDPERWDPERLLVAALSQCHLLSYLHVCAVEDVVVLSYEDRATGVMEEEAEGGGQFVEVTLHPLVEVADQAMVERARELHGRASSLCFIARSMAFPVRHEPEIRVAGARVA
jgi:organic hydroperoxide reductase OsmC/OhrA